MAVCVRELSARKGELSQIQSVHAERANREKALEEEVDRVKAKYEDIISALQRQLADSKNAFSSLKREMSVNEEESLAKLREEQAAR